MKKKKISEINLNPDYSAASFPNHRRNSLSTGAPTMSADQHFSRNVMSRVNKDLNLEEEELDDFVEELELIKEFFDASAVDKFLGGIKSGFMSIPIIGDAFAFGKFMFTVAKLRRANRQFTKKLGKLSQVDLGNDFLEPEGSLSDARVLDENLTEALYRITNLKQYPDLKVTTMDIKNLDAKFAIMCKYVKDAIMEFIGFADFAFGQKGFFVNMGINFVTFSELPDYLTGEYAALIDDMTFKARQKEGENFSSLKNFFGNVLSTLGYPFRKIGDFLGNVDLLINPEKLHRLSLVHNALKHYRDVDTSEEYFQQGLEAVPGSKYYYYLRDIKNTDPASVLDPENQMSITESEVDLKKFLDANKDILLRENDLSELYEEESVEEESVEEIVGAITPLGTKADGSLETAKERSDRIKKADIYRKHLQEVQNWKHMTSGRRK